MQFLFKHKGNCLKMFELIWGRLVQLISNGFGHRTLEWKN